MKKITDKDKKDWKNFTSGKDKVQDKDNLNIQFKEKEFLKSIDLHGYTLDQANQKISYFLLYLILEKLRWSFYNTIFLEPL